jgi:hypothetical protein
MDYKKNFKNPPRRYAVYPILHGDILSKNPDELFDAGFAGAVGNIPFQRPDCADGNGEYPFINDNAVWQKTEDAFRAYIQKGMTTWIYDEKGYPSGSAGGAVIDAHPEFKAQGLYCYEYWMTLSGPTRFRADVQGDNLYKAYLIPLDGREAIDVTDSQTAALTLLIDVPTGEYRLLMLSSRRLFDGTHAAESYSEPRDYISLSDKAATKAFIEVTHELYKARLKDEFGKGVPAFFTDEPSLVSWSTRPGLYPILPWLHTYPAEFEAKYGYPFGLAAVAVLTRKGPQYVKRRCDFWEYIADTVSENFFGTIQDWCRQNGLKSSGHMLGEETLQSHVYAYGSFYRCAKRFDWPGIDKIYTNPLTLMRRDLIPTARLVASVSDISGENEAFTEFSDIIDRSDGYQIGMPWIYGSANWHFAQGVNNFTSYYDFSPFSADELRGLNGYVARVGLLLRQGVRDSRVAFLYPEASAWAAYTPSIDAWAIDSSEETKRLDAAFAKGAWELLDRQIDFDFVDEKLIAAAKIKDGKLCYKNRAYESIVFPASRVLSEATVDKICKMADAGLGLVFIGDLPEVSRETGIEDAFYKKLSPYIGSKNFCVVRDGKDWHLPAASRVPLPRTIRVRPKNVRAVLSGAAGEGGYSDGEVVSPNIMSHTRLLADGGRIVFLCNMGGTVYDGVLTVAGGKSVEEASPYTGEIRPLQGSVAGGAVSVDICLKPYEGCCYIVKCGL